MGEQLQDAVVQGTCDARFAEVQEQFERNFAERDELGASVCVVLDGEVVADLWGGVADEAAGRAWDRDTVNVIASCSKGVTAICGNVLIDRGELDPDKPVAHYWPEFAQAGKEAIPVRQVLNHQSGLFTFGEQLPERGAADWEACIAALERTAPFWEPGTKVGYHALTIGYLVGELVRRVDGRTVGRFLAEEVAGPRGLDVWIGIPPEVEERVAPSIPFDMTKLPPEHLAQLTDPSSPTAQVFGNTGGWIEGWDHPDLHAAELPAVGAITNARGLAGVYAAAIDGSLVGEATLAGMRTTQSATDHDHVLQYRTTYTMGLSKSWTAVLPDGTTSGVCIGEDAFGTPGFGGQIGFADPGCGLAFAYTMNRHGEGTALNDRGQSLIDAVYRALGSPGTAGGQWIRPRR